MPLSTQVAAMCGPHILPDLLRCALRHFRGLKAVLEKLRGTPNVCMVGLYAYNPPAILAGARADVLAHTYNNELLGNNKPKQRFFFSLNLSQVISREKRHAWRMIPRMVRAMMPPINTYTCHTGLHGCWLGSTHSGKYL